MSLQHILLRPGQFIFGERWLETKVSVPKRFRVVITSLQSGINHRNASRRCCDILAIFWHY
jgi:hypothetical protein